MKLGVHVDSVSRHALSPPAKLGLVMGYSLFEEPDIVEGVRRLATLV